MPLLAIVLTACLILGGPEEEEEGRVHGGSEQPRGRPSVMEKQSKRRKKEGVVS